MSTPVPSATISYICQIGDTRPGICAKLWPQTGYGSFGALLTDIMTLNKDITDWTTDLSGLPILVPTVPGS